MKRMAVLLLIGCSLAGLSCTRRSVPPTAPDDNTILSLALSHEPCDGDYTVVAPQTGTGPIAFSDPSEMAELRKYILAELKVPEADLAKLLDEFAARNASPVTLTLSSAPERGYLVDYKGEYDRYFEDDGGGWDQWYKDHPKADGSTTVSLPVRDGASGVVLLYIGTQSHWLAGAGHLIAYKYDGEALKEIGRVMLWIS